MLSENRIIIAVPAVGIKVFIDGYKVSLLKKNTEKIINKIPKIEIISLKISEKEIFLWIKMYAHIAPNANSQALLNVE